jgi:hypothetical protein
MSTLRRIGEMGKGVSAPSVKVPITDQLRKENLTVDFKIETPEGEDALTEFVLFKDRATEGIPARWPAVAEMQVPLLTGDSPFCEDRDGRPFTARNGGEIVARAVAMVDNRYNRHWNERIGHITMFDALPGSSKAVHQMMDDACSWLADRGAVAARTGFSLAGFDMPFAMDSYDVLPPSMLRQNTAEYHTHLKRAGFEVEKGCVDYKLEVTPELLERWQRYLESVKQGGFEIVPARDLEPEERVREFTDTFNDTFKTHWGWVPFTQSEMEFLFDAFGESSILDTSVIAYLDGESAGFITVASDDPGHALLESGRQLDDSEKLNFLGIGVREGFRGRGVNYAMAAYSFLELARRGWTHLSYTLVLDDNWASRRTGERLGCEVCANYLVYRRNF